MSDRSLEGLLDLALQGQPLNFDPLTKEEVITLFTQLQQAYHAPEVKQPSPKISHLMILDALPMLITYIDRDLIYRFCNRAHRNQFGYDATGRTVQSVVPENFLESVKPHIDRVLSGETVNYRNVVYQANGRTQWLDAEYVPDKDEAGHVRGFFTLVRDITTRYEAEQRTLNLHQIANAFSQAMTLEQVLEVITNEVIPLVGSVSGVVAVLQEDHESIEIIAQRNITRETLNELQNMTIHSPFILSECIRTGRNFWIDDVRQFFREYSHIRTIFKHENIEAALCLPMIDQSSTLGAVSFSFSGKHIFDEAERVYLWTIIQQCAQAVGRVRFLQNILQERERFLVTLASIGDGVIATDPRGIVNFMNPAAEKLTGRSLYEAVHHPLSQVFRLKPGASENEKLLVARDGHTVPIASTSTPIRDSQGKTHGTVVVFRDIRERKQIEIAEREQRILAEAFQSTALAITSTLELGDVVDQILLSIGKVVPHDAAKVILVGEGRTAMLKSRGYKEHGLADFEAILIESPNLIERLTRLHQIMGTHEPLLIAETVNDPHWLDIPEASRIQSFVGAPILSGDEVLGFIGLDSLTPGFFNETHVSRLQIFAAQAAIAIKNARLYQQVQEAVVLEERQRLSRDLHDAVSQMLFSSSVIAEALPRLQKVKPELVQDQLARVARLNRGALAEMRTLLLELRQPDLVDLDLAALLRQLADAVMGHTEMEITTRIDANHEPLPIPIRIIFYRIAQEALNNISKHAHAQHVEITLAYQPDQKRTTLSIKDDGQGFAPASNSSQHLGLRIMQERVSSIGAELQIWSKLGQGTTVSLNWQP